MAQSRPSRLIPVLVTAAFAAVVMLLLFGRGRGRPRPPASPVPLRVAADRRTGDVVLAPQVRAVPGLRSTARLSYRNRAVTNVLVAGAWDGWVRHPMQRQGKLWQLDVQAAHVPFGQHEYKFLPNGAWEPGPNRILFVNEEGLLERPPDLVFSARLETPTRIDVLFRRSFEPEPSMKVRTIPPVPLAKLEWRIGSDNLKRLGYAVAGHYVTFCLDEQVYGLSLRRGDRVGVAGTFNGWNPNARGGWHLERGPEKRVWQRTFALDELRAGHEPAEGSEPEIQFKFVINGSRWLTPPLMAVNAVDDGKGNVNLVLDPAASAAPSLRIHARAPLAWTNTYTLVLENIVARPIYRTIAPGALLDELRTDAPLGLFFDRAQNRATFRLFAPRASGVELLVSPHPDPLPQWGEGGGVALPHQDSLSPPGERVGVRGWSAHTLHLTPPTGTWQTHLDGLPFGSSYTLRVNGPSGAGEGFLPREPVGDPYARAVTHERGACIVLDPEATNQWFAGWTDADWQAPAWEDAVLYETHVRDLTVHPSSGVPPAQRGTYAGILASRGTGTGLDHLRELGVNMIELMPVQEFENATNAYGWGYSPVYYFAPESSYGRDPARGSQYYELKHLVNALHEQGFGVILDVVYNHVGGPNVFSAIDRKYYFRMDQDFLLSNFSGCGNDVRTEAPMMRRLIVENILYLMQEFHVDGFRFDLAELIDMETLMAVRDAARAVNPRVLLISEPWSFRGDHKDDLKGRGWASWNNLFRDAVRRFVKGEGDKEDLRKAIRGSVDWFAAHPLQAVNYLESHDDRCLADDLAPRSDHDGRRLTETTAARNRLAATILFTSLGIPMLGEGQEFIRSKHGLHNTYNQGDAINALRWDDRNRPLAAETLRYYRDLLRLRQSEAGRTFRLTNVGAASAPRQPLDGPGSVPVQPAGRSRGGTRSHIPPESASTAPAHVGAASAPRSADDRSGASSPIPDRYFRWYGPAGDQALGYLVNGQGKHPGAPFLVLLNAQGRKAAFQVDLPPGQWRLVGNGRRIDPAGLEVDGKRMELQGGNYRLKVPALSAYIFMAQEDERRRRD